MLPYVVIFAFVKRRVRKIPMYLFNQQGVML